MPNTNPVFIAGHTGITPLSQSPRYTTFKKEISLPDGSFMAVGAGGLTHLNADGTVASQNAAYGEMGTGQILVATGFKLLPDGKAIVGGYWFDGNNHKVNGFGAYRLNADGSVDKTFGKGKGWVTTDPGDQDISVATLVNKEGKILVVGTSGPTTVAEGSNYIAISRFTADGKLDTSFGNMGSVLTPGNKVWLTSAQLQSDGKILAAGSHNAGQILSDSVLFRFNADGTPDTSFGTGGKLTLKFLQPYEHGSEIKAIAIQPDGKIVTAGSGPAPSFGTAIEEFAIARFNPDGTLDKEFGNDGKVQVFVGPNQGTWVGGANAYGLAEANALVIRKDGTIVLGGSVTYNEGSFQDQFALLALRPDGEVDTSFGHNGMATTVTGPNMFAWAYSLTETVDGKLVLSGETGPQGGGSSANVMASFNADGTPNTSFGELGTGTQNHASYKEGYQAITLNPDISLHDSDLAASSYQGSFLQLQRHGGANKNDSFEGIAGLSLADGNITIDGLVIGTARNTGGSLRIDFNANASESLVNKALHGIGYRYTADPSTNQTVLIDWTFSDGSQATAKASTEIKLTASTVPVWIDQLLATGDAAALKDDLLTYLGPDKSLGIRYVNDPNATPLSSADTKLIDGLIAKLASVVDLKPNATATASMGSIDIHSSSEIAAGATSYTELSDYGADIFVGKPASGVSSVLPELNQRLLQSLGLEDNSVKSSLLNDQQIAALQYLYGPSMTVRTGNDNYRLSADKANFLWDGKGSDTIDGSTLSKDLTLHLEAGHWDYIGTQAASITAAGQITVNFGSVFENAIGGNGNDHLYGTTGSNILRGGAGNDVLAGYGGGDTIDGGMDLDTVSYAGKLADYKISKSGSGYAVTGKDGIDTLSNVERLHFDNGDVALDINGNAGQLFRLYQAIFNRKPDLAGLGWWLDAVDRGVSLESVAESFTQSKEFATMYGAGASNTTLLTKIYEYALHRTPDKDGFAFWLDVLDNQKAGLGSVLMGFSESQENYAQVIGSIQNGIAYTAFHS